MKQQIKSLITTITCFCFALGVAQNKKELPKHEKEAMQLIFQGNQEITKEKANVIEAEKSYRKAIAKDPNNAIAKYNLGVSYSATQNFQEAAQRNEQAAKLAKNPGEKHAAYHNLGNSHMGTGELEKAIEAYKNALRNNPTDYQTRYNLALAKKAKQEQDKNKPKEGDKDKEKGDDDKEKDSSEDKEDEEGDKDKEDENNGEDEEDKKDDGEDKDDKSDDDKDGDEEKKPEAPREGKLSPEQVKSLLQAMENQEKEVQEKVNAQKVKGAPVKTDKDW